MLHSKIFIISFSAALGVIAFIELFLLLPVTKRVHRLIGDSNKSLSVIRSHNISDHWKEKVFSRYARHIMVSSLLITFYLAILFLAFGVVYCLSAILFLGNLYEVIDLFYQIETQIIAVIFGILYAYLRKKTTISKEKSNVDYTLSSKALHHIALNNSKIKELAFDIDCMITKFRSRVFEISSPVYISGLARAGTTILLEALYSTGAFTTLTYRDMPFVTAPYLWSKVTKGHMLKESLMKERAHGDQLYVNYDSPEAFEEVFWMTFSDAAYVKNSYLELHDIETELLKKYNRFVGNIIARQENGVPLRYLAKNNNNLMRIKAIKSVFADSIIIVPFRNPLDHAKSLHIQHERFLEKNNEDPFSLKYMSWLGHYEFGAGFKSFKVSPEALPKNREEPRRLDYWLRYWKCVYEYVIENNASDVIFFNYDKFCENPDAILDKLESELSLKDGSLKPFSTNIRSVRKYVHPLEAQILPHQIRNIYERLQGLSL